MAFTKCGCLDQRLVVSTNLGRRKKARVPRNFKIVCLSPNIMLQIPDALASMQSVVQRAQQVEDELSSVDVGCDVGCDVVLDMLRVMEADVSGLGTLIRVTPAEMALAVQQGRPSHTAYGCELDGVSWSSTRCHFPQGYPCDLCWLQSANWVDSVDPHAMEDVEVQAIHEPLNKAPPGNPFNDAHDIAIAVVEDQNF